MNIKTAILSCMVATAYMLSSCATIASKLHGVRNNVQLHNGPYPVQLTLLSSVAKETINSSSFPFGEGTNNVYYGVDNMNNVRYVGIKITKCLTLCVCSNGN
jgi:hypothetical protein